MNYHDALALCKAFDSGSHFAIIRSEAQQKFLSQLLFNQNKLVDNVWIDAKWDKNQFKWSDSSQMTYSAWNKGEPKNLTNHDCVEMISDSTPPGLWGDKPCTVKNVALCEKIQIWSNRQLVERILNTERLINDLAHPVPVGYIHMQLYNQAEPKDIWPNFEWKDISSDYAGLFFRVHGGGSANFGLIQDENIPQITKLLHEYVPEAVSDSSKHFQITLDKNISDLYYKAKVPGDNFYQQFHFEGMRVVKSFGEIRPRNQAIKIWKRIK